MQVVAKFSHTTLRKHTNNAVSVSAAAFSAGNMPDDIIVAAVEYGRGL